MFTCRLRRPRVGGARMRLTRFVPVDSTSFRALLTGAMRFESGPRDRLGGGGAVTAW